MTVSQKQLEANKKNAQKGGVKTPKGKAFLSKRRIREIASQYTNADPDVVALARMAEKHRQAVRAAKKAKRRKPKNYLKPTDYLTPEQFAKIVQVVRSKAKAARAKDSCMNRAVLNEMLIILLAETGLRAAEVCNLKLKDLPGYHGKHEIAVRSGKGGKDRTVATSEYLSRCLTKYAKRYHSSRSPESWLFKNEQGGAISYRSIYSKIKKIGRQAGIWPYTKNGKLRSRLSPHKFRHTYATLLLDVSDNDFLVQSQLGHEKLDTTQIYARTLKEKLRAGVKGFHYRLWTNVNAEISPKL